MSKEELTFEKLPEAISILLSEVKELKSIVSKKDAIGNKRVPISIDEASKILNKAKPTIYTMVRSGRLKAYKQGKRLYFFEDELLKHIERGELRTTHELKEEALNHFKR